MFKLSRHTLRTFFALTTASLMAYAVNYGQGVVVYGTAEIPVKATELSSPALVPSANTSAAIQVAIDCLAGIGTGCTSNSGGTVDLDTGTYWISSPIILRSNVRLLGDGAGQTILKRHAHFQVNLAEDTGPDDPCYPSSTFLIGAELDSNYPELEHVAIRSLTIDGNYNEAFLEDRRPVVNCFEIHGTGGSGEYYAHYVLIKDIEATGCAQGIHISGATRVRVETSDIHHNGGHHLWHNIYFRRTGRLLFLSNTIRDSILGSGLKLAGGTTTVADESRYVTIRDNDFTDNDRIGINLQGMHHVVVEDNEITDGGADVSGACQDTDCAGIHIQEYNSYYCRYTDVINNLVEDNYGHGVKVDGCNTFALAGNFVDNNGPGASFHDYDLSAVSSYCVDDDTRVDDTGCY